MNHFEPLLYVALKNIVYKVIYIGFIITDKLQFREAALTHIIVKGSSSVGNRFCC